MQSRKAKNHLDVMPGSYPSICATLNTEVQKYYNNKYPVFQQEVSRLQLFYQVFKRDFSATQSLQVTNVTPKGVVPFSIELRSIFYFRVEVFGQWILSSGLYGTALPKYIGMRSRKATGPSSTKQRHYEQINHHITSTAVTDFRVGFLDDQERCKCYRVLRNNYFENFFL